MYELSGIEIQELQELSDKVRKGMMINPETMEAMETPDFNIYLEGDELTMYEKLKKTCKALNELKQSITTIQMGAFVNGTGTAMVYNWQTHQLEPNLSYIKLAHRR